MWPSHHRGQFSLDELWRRVPRHDAYVYACGLETLLSGLEDSARRADREEQLAVERFDAVNRAGASALST